MTNPTKNSPEFEREESDSTQKHGQTKKTGFMAGQNKSILHDPTAFRKAHQELMAQFSFEKPPVLSVASEESVAQLAFEEETLSSPTANEEPVAQMAFENPIVPPTVDEKSEAQLVFERETLSFPVAHEGAMAQPVFERETLALSIDGAPVAQPLFEKETLSFPVAHQAPVAQPAFEKNVIAFPKEIIAFPVVNDEPVAQLEFESPALPSIVNEETITFSPGQDFSRVPSVANMETMQLPPIAKTPALPSIADVETVSMLPAVGVPKLSSVVEEKTVPLLDLSNPTLPSLVGIEVVKISAPGEEAATSAKSLPFLPRMVAMALTRLREPNPESWSRTLIQKAIKLQEKPLGWLPFIFLIQTIGIALVAYAGVASIQTTTNQDMYLWLGLILIFTPAFHRLLSPMTLRLERIIILCSVGLWIYLVPGILSPDHFIFVDEYLHLRTINDIIITHHLFSTNSLLPISPVYPGLEIVTNALVSISGLDSRSAGWIVVGVARLVGTLAMFLLFEQVAKSSRTASIAGMLYMANAGFLMFDSLFLYESLGLAFGIFLLFALYSSETRGQNKGGLLIVACITIGALTVTHHVSDLIFVLLLVLWTIMQIYTKKPLWKSNVIKVTLVGLACAVLWVSSAARPVISYLGAPVISTLTQLQAVLLQTGGGRQFFVDYSGSHPTPLWARLSMLAALGLVSLGVPFAFVSLWHRYRSQAFPFMLAIVALCYPLTQLLRLTSESVNLPDRASPYVYIAVSFALGVLIAQVWPVRKLKWKKITLIACVVGVVFIGGNLLGSGPGWRLVPGDYLVNADGRSVDRLSVETALWTRQHLGPNNRVYGGSTDALLLNAYGDQYVVSIWTDGVDIAPVYFALTYDKWELDILKNARVRYLVVDLRMSESLPVKGYYFNGAEAPDINITTPISRQALTKFDTIPNVNRIYDNGTIIIYDVGGLTDAAKEP